MSLKCEMTLAKDTYEHYPVTYAEMYCIVRFAAYVAVGYMLRILLRQKCRLGHQRGACKVSDTYLLGCLGRTGVCVLPAFFCQNPAFLVFHTFHFVLTHTILCFSARYWHSTGHVKNLYNIVIKCSK